MRVVTSCNLSFFEEPWPQRDLAEESCYLCRVPVDCFYHGSVTMFCCKVSPSMVRVGVGGIGWSLICICMGDVKRWVGGLDIGEHVGLRTRMTGLPSGQSCG